jgi:hypothetical protein
MNNRNRRVIVFQYTQGKHMPLITKVFKFPKLAYEHYQLLEPKEKQSLTMYAKTIRENRQPEYLMLNYEGLIKLLGSGNKPKNFMTTEQYLNGKKTQD